MLSSGGQLKLIAGGREIAAVTPPLVVGGNGPLALLGVGAYHGELQFRPLPNGGVQTINQVDLEDYVRGVIPAEMPSSWPMQALDAQAVAARTYAIAVGAASPTFDVYSDTRSQVYGGVTAQTPSGDAAEAATRGEVVDYAGQPATTYFFSSSGGYTESVQNVFLGLAPEAWLIGVPDPYDDADDNPYYRWHENLSVGAAAHRLGKLVKGSLEGIKVLQRGVSPRIVQAAVVGTKGTKAISGPGLRRLFGLRSTYISFMTIRTKSVTSKTPAVPTKPGAPKAGRPKPSASTTSTTPGPKVGAKTMTVTTPTPSTGGGGLSARARRGARFRYALAGSTFPAVAGQAVLAERLVTGGWRRADLGRLTTEGSYEIRSAGQRPLPRRLPGHRRAGGQRRVAAVRLNSGALVAEQNGVGGLPGLDQPQRCRRARIVEQPLAAADHDREHHQAVLVDQTMSVELTDQPVAALDEDLADHVAQPRHVIDEIPLEDRGVRPRRVYERPRDDVLRHRVHLLAEVVLVPIRPRGREALVGPPTE